MIPWSMNKDRVPYFILLSVLVILHLIIFIGPVQSDGAVEMAIARNILNYGRIEIFGSPDTHFPPVIPFMLLPFIAILGDNTLSIHISQYVYYLLSIFVAYRAGSIRSSRAGFALSLFIASDPILLGSMMGATSEIILQLFILLSLYFYMKIDEAPWSMVPASFFASMAYLCKATSVTIAIGAIMAVAFVFRKFKPETIRNARIMAVSTVVFITPILLWSIRNYLLLSVWDTNSYTSNATRMFISSPWKWYLLVIYIIIFALWSLIPLIPYLIYSYSRFRAIMKDLLYDIRTSELTYIFSGFLLLAALGGASLIAYEPALYENPYFSVQHIRYVSVGIPIILLPVLWSLAERKVNLLVPSIAMVVILSTVSIPVIQGEMSFVREYNEIGEYLHEWNVTEVWADVSCDIRYNIPWLEVHHFSSIRDVPDNSTVITTDIVDSPPAKKFWRYAVTVHLSRPPEVQEYSISVVHGTVYSSISVQWKPLNITDLKGYVVLISSKNSTNVDDFKWYFTEKAEFILPRVTSGRYYIAIISMDTHNNHVYSVHPHGIIL